MEEKIYFDDTLPPIYDDYNDSSLLVPPTMEDKFYYDYTMPPTLDENNYYIKWQQTSFFPNFEFFFRINTNLTRLLSCS
jgi:hypothetical protein